VRDCAIVDPAMVGRPGFFVVALRVERERAEADFILIVSAPIPLPMKPLPRA
jgi:hypothetical protein